MTARVKSAATMTAWRDGSHRQRAAWTTVRLYRAMRTSRAATYVLVGEEGCETAVYLVCLDNNSVVASTYDNDNVFLIVVIWYSEPSHEINTLSG